VTSSQVRSLEAEVVEFTARANNTSEEMRRMSAAVVAQRAELEKQIDLAK
jgi:hypothetical protein